jgi:aspartate kinase
MPSGQFIQKYTRDLNDHLGKLERFYYGLNFTKEITPKMMDVISSFGERLSADLLSTALRARGLKATYRMPHKIGIVTDGKFGDATANLQKTSHNLRQHLLPLIKEGMIVFVPGFFGVSEKGEITTFGRGGTDYSAAVVAAALNAEVLEFWKDVPGYMSADPKFVPEARMIPFLSYDEAAELSYFGAKILHPRTVEPLRRLGLAIAVKNTMNRMRPAVSSRQEPPGPSVIRAWPRHGHCDLKCTLLRGRMSRVLARVSTITGAVSTSSPWSHPKPASASCWPEEISIKLIRLSSS